MGRHYSGNIEGKFWFAVQNSNDGEFFGAVAQEPAEIDYYVDDIDKVNEGVTSCLRILGKHKEQLDKFFEVHNSYNDEMLAKELGVNKLVVADLLVWYARLELGLKIQKCVEENGECNFSAEL